MSGTASAIVNICNARGLHARASAKFVKTASGFESEVRVTRDGTTVDARSIMGLLMLGAGLGCDIEIAAEGPKLVMDPARHECTWDGLAVKLTVTEFLLLQALAQRPGFVKSRDSLMDAAYDDQVYVDDRTIDSHVKRMRKKFRVVDPEFDAIETLYGVGYRYRES